MTAIATAIVTATGMATATVLATATASARATAFAVKVIHGGSLMRKYSFLCMLPLMYEDDLYSL